MRSAQPVKVHVRKLAMSPDEERRFWTAVDDFLEVFVRHEIDQMRRDAAPVTDPTSPAASNTDPTLPPLLQ